MYDGFILPHLNFCIAAWGFNTNRITKLQKRSIRIICNAKYNAHTDPLLKKMNILKVHDIFELKCLKIYHNYLNSKVPYYISTLFPVTHHPHNTRHRGQLIARSTSARSSNTLRHRIPKLLQTLPDLSKDKLTTHSPVGFSIHLKKIK